MGSPPFNGARPRPDIIVLDVQMLGLDGIRPPMNQGQTP